MLAVGEHLWGKVSPAALRMAGIFAGGLAGTRQEMCGAASGACMIIGALYGRASLDEQEALARDLASRFRQLFEERFGTTRCAPIRERHEVPGAKGWCAPVAEGAVALLFETLARPGP